MAGAAPYIFPTNAMTTQFAQAAVADKAVEVPDNPFEAEPARVTETQASSDERDADGKYSGFRGEPDEFEGVFALGRTRFQRRAGHVLERLAGLGSVVDSEY